ncbi:MAG: hypothetical protein ACKO7R_13745, partial [Pseudanabaena sp.]
LTTPLQRNEGISWCLVQYYLHPLNATVRSKPVMSVKIIFLAKISPSKTNWSLIILFQIAICAARSAVQMVQGGKNRRAAFTILRVRRIDVK